MPPPACLSVRLDRPAVDEPGADTEPAPRALAVSAPAAAVARPRGRDVDEQRRDGQDGQDVVHLPMRLSGVTGGFLRVAVANTGRSYVGSSGTI